MTANLGHSSRKLETAGLEGPASLTIPLIASVYSTRQASQRSASPIVARTISLPDSLR